VPEEPTEAPAVGDPKPTEEPVVAEARTAEAPVIPEPAPEPAPVETPKYQVPALATRVSPLKRFAFLAIPAIALLELGAHVLQITNVVTNTQWMAARDAVRTLAKPEDLVVMAPYWTDPIGRELFKDEILSIAREARPDSSRFPRAVEVSIRGKHLDELADWKIESKKQVGPVTLTVLDNPSYTPLKDDLVDHVAPGKMSVSVVSGAGAVECAFTHGPVETGGLGFGPAIPSSRFACPGGATLSATVMMPGDYRPHRCLFMPPMGSGKTLRVRFLGVAFGQLLHGHAGIDWDSTAHAEEPPVTLVWKLGDRTLGRIVSGTDDGWKPFALDTRELDGQTGEIVAEVSTPATHNRLYCFEADTR